MKFGAHAFPVVLRARSAGCSFPVVCVCVWGGGRRAGATTVGVGAVGSPKILLTAHLTTAPPGHPELWGRLGTSLPVEDLTLAHDLRLNYVPRRIPPRLEGD